MPIWFHSHLTWRMIWTLCLAAMGGAVFSLLNLPLPWMLGAMVATMVAALLRVPMGRTQSMRPPFAAILGVTLGANFQPAAFFQNGSSLLMLAVLTMVSTILCGMAAYQYLHRMAAFDPITAYFAAMPAGLQEMTMAGGRAGGDERHIALIHAARVCLLVLIIPLAYAYWFHTDSQTQKMLFRQGGDGITLLDWLWFAVFAILGWFLGKRLKLPNAAMIGPLLLSALFHLGGWMTAMPPSWLIIFAQIAIGSALGSNFIGSNWKIVWQSLRHGLALVPILIMICAMVVLLASFVTNIEPSVLFLALAPGGVTEMSLIAFSLHAEVVLVISSQLLRILLVNLGASSLLHLGVIRASK